MSKVTNHTLAAHDQMINALPDGTTVNILAEDFVNGNFDTCEIVIPEGFGYDATHHTVAYTGPVRDGYFSTFERSE